MRTDENIGLDFTFTLLKSALENYFQHILATTSIQAPNFEYYLSEFTKQAQEHLIEKFQQRNGFKVWVVLDAVYSKPIGEGLEETTLQLSAKTIVIQSLPEIPTKLQQLAAELKVRNETLLRLQSVLNLVEIKAAHLNLADHKPLTRGASYTPLPSFLAHKTAIINVKNKDERCFGYAILSAIFPVDNANHPDKTFHYNDKFNWHGMDKLKYPVEIEDIPSIEMDLNISINVFSFHDDAGHARYPEYLSKLKSHIIVDLLHWNGHYAWIKNFSRFMGDISKKHYVKHFCRKCLGHFSFEAILLDHSKWCTGDDNISQVYTMPEEGSILSFEHIMALDQVPFIVYADFECLVPPINKQGASVLHSVEYQHHEPYSIGLKLISRVPQLQNVDYQCYTGLGCTEWFLKQLIALEELCKAVFMDNKRMVFTEDDRERHENATECHICHHPFGGIPIFSKVRDHNHYTGIYRGAAHWRCNILMRKSYKVPVIFHNFRGYDSHLVVQALGKFKDRKIRVLGQTIEKYLTISWGDHIVFKDSLQFLNLSLENLVGNLLKSGKENFPHLTNAFDKKELDLLLRKGVYPYDYMDSPQRLEEQQLPPIQAFFSRLRDCDISPDDYQHAQHVWTAFHCKKMLDYHELYLKSMF